MKRLAWMWVLAILMVLAVPVAWSQEQEEEKGQEPAKAAEEESAEKPESKESKVAGTPYIYSGPDTGVGAGFAIIYRDLAGKVGRDTSFSASFTQSQYQEFSVDWTEPDIIRKGPRLNLYANFENKPARRFYGFGNDTSKKDVCNWGWTMYELRPRVILPRDDAQWRARLQYSYQYAMPKDGTLEDSEDWRYSRPISEQFSKLYNSSEFDGGATAGPGIYLIHDNIKDRFPIGGGRSEKVFPVSGGYQELFFNYNGPMFGSRFEYYLAQADIRQYFGFFKDNTVLVLRGKMIATFGEVPFWNLPSFGGGNDLRGFYDGRFRGKDSTQYNVELRQGIAPNFKWPLLGGRFNITYPFLFAFFEAGRVYDSYTDLGAEWNKDYHPSYGGGLRFIISPSVVVRFEWAYSPEFLPVFPKSIMSTSFILNVSEPF